VNALSWAASSLVFLVSIGLAGWFTDGFQVFDSETARRLHIARTPVVIPAFILVDQSGRILRFPGDFGPDRMLIVDFIYTRCNSICSVLSSDFERLQRALVTRELGKQVHLVTISFDPLHDDAKTIAIYAARKHSNPAVWTIATLTNPKQLQALLTTFGIVVIPAPFGQLEHNAALHVLDGQGRMIAIYDWQHAETVLGEILARAQ
jgi:protein SCO1